MKFRRLVAAYAVAPLVLLAAAPGAFADDIYNNLDGSIDAVAEVMPLTVGGPNGSTTLAVNPTGGDGKSGCNLTGSTTLTLDITSSDVSTATVSPARVTFTSCGDVKTLSVVPLSVGGTTISASVVSNTSQGSFDLAPATFTVNVTAPVPANTAPVVDVGGVTGGASYPKGAVPTATCEVTDTEDGPTSFPATLSDITGPDAANGIGAQTASCEYTDKGGLYASSSVTYDIVDATEPEVSYVLTPATPDGLNGWYRSDVTLSWTVTEPESTSTLVKDGCIDQTITADQAETTYTCQATSAGGASDVVTATVKRDTTAPSVVASEPEGTLGANGWFTSDVTVTFTATDDLSGPATDSAVVTSSGEGSEVEIVSPAFTDLAGNTTPAGSASRTVKIDKTAPTDIAFVGMVDGAHYDFGSVPAQPTCTATDAVSGLAGCEVSGYATTVGSHDLTATATDRAGNSSTRALTYTVDPYRWTGFYAPVDMGKVLNTVKAGSTVPLKFEVFTSTSELTSTAVVSTFTVKPINCNLTPSDTDAIELTTTGGTALRYDTTAGQFVQNWKTPATPGACYSVSVTTNDGQTHTAAQFKLR